VDVQVSRREYQLERRIAVGGMAEVFLARLSGGAGFQRQVVIKKIHPRWAQNQDVLSLFRDEARLGAALRHHNIVQVLDYGRSGESTYLVLEFVNGRNLAELISAAADDRRYLPPVVAAFAVAECCGALEHIHSRRDVNGEHLGVVHRDINPANVLLSWDGEVKLTDFGVAAGHHRELQTAHGILRGTFPYMSPEQTLCRPLDGRSDIFSLGVVLYEALTAHHPFADDDDYLTIKAIQDEEPASADRLRAELDPALSAIVRRAMAKDRDERYSSAREFQEDLFAWIRAAGTSHGAATLAREMERSFPEQRANGKDVRPERIRLGPTRPGSGKPLLDLTRLEARRGPRRVGGAIVPDDTYTEEPKPVETDDVIEMPPMPAPWDERVHAASASIPPTHRGPVSMERMKPATLPRRRPRDRAWMGWLALLMGALGVLAWALVQLG
jgi:eukaryotic-like serine/threonine-protein kinase